MMTYIHFRDIQSLENATFTIHPPLPQKKTFLRLTRAFTNLQLKDITVVVFPLSKHFMTVLKNVPTFQELKPNPPRKQFILLNKQTREQRNWTETMIRSHGEEN